MKNKLGKKGVFDNLTNLLTSLGALAILTVIIFLIIASVKTQVRDINGCANATYVLNVTDMSCSPNGNSTMRNIDGLSEAYKAMVTTQDTASDIPGWLPIVIITIIGGILLMLVRFFKQGQ
jgi:hypothetical protein